MEGVEGEGAGMDIGMGAKNWGKERGVGGVAEWAFTPFLTDYRRILEEQFIKKDITRDETQVGGEEGSGGDGGDFEGEKGKGLREGDAEGEM